MSLYRQVWLSIISSMLLALVASLFVTLYNGRAYLETQLSLKNRDNAATLALALSQEGMTADDLAVAITAQFNSGQYEYLLITDPQGRSLVERIAPPAEPEAPRWFMSLLPIRPNPGTAQISSGWQQVGTLSLMSHTHFAYRDLWAGVITLCVVMLLAGLLGGGLGSLALGRLRKPIRSVIDQAHAIRERRFTTIPEPALPELRELAAAMNDMVSRLRQELQEDAQHYEGLRRAANYDTLTGLANRSFFMANLSRTLADEDSVGGSLAIIRVARLEHINRHFGREVADSLLVRVSQTLGAMGAECPDIFAARLKGADFALLLASECDPRSVLDILQDKLAEIMEPYAERMGSSYIGFATFQPGEPVPDLLARIDQAVAVAESAGHDAVCEASPSDQSNTPVTTEDWRLALRHVLAHTDHLTLARYPLLLNEVTQCECHLRIRLAGSPEWLPAHRFMPQAERLGMASDLDLAAVTLALDALEMDPNSTPRWVTLSPRSVADADFRDRLMELLMLRRKNLGRLRLEVREIGALQYLDSLRELVRIMQPLDCHLGLSHYGHQFSRIGDFYDLGLDFIKVDTSFIRDIHVHPGNQAFLAGLVETAHKLGLQVLAEGVESRAEMEKLRELGMDGFTGQALDDVLLERVMAKSAPSASESKD